MIRSLKKAQRKEELASNNREHIAQHVTANEQQLQRLDETTARIVRLRVQVGNSGPRGRRRSGSNGGHTADSTSK